MAPLTRSRAGAARLPNDLMREYYVQRASAGLILSEATCVTPMGVGYADTPGVWSAEQAAGWKRVTEGVHGAGGRISCSSGTWAGCRTRSFWTAHCPWRRARLRPGGHVSLVRPERPFVTPRALETAEIPGVVEAYRQGAENAQAAGFDGVEIHGANGYLLDQFLQDSTNHRTDEYGGSVEKRARLMLEVTDAAISVWGADRVGMHLSPRADVHSMGDSDPAATFGYVARELGARKIAFICARESLMDPRLGPGIKRAFGGVFVANEKFTQETAQRAIDAGEADAVAFGVAFIANPDLPRRFAEGAELNAPDPSTFYVPGAKGYTDYPALG